MENTLITTFGNENYHFTVCKNDLYFPDESERTNIVEKYYDSTTGGHHVINKLYTENFWG